MINLKIDTNLNEFKAQLPLSQELQPKVLEDIAEIIRKDIETNLIQGTGLDGKGLQSKKFGGRLFYQSGTLLSSIKKKLGKNEAEVFVSSIRAKIASYINYGTRKMISREFFGISQRALLEIDKYLLTKSKDELFKKRF